MFEPRQRVVDRYRSTLQHRLARHGGQYKIIACINENSTVLDVGCASGYIGKALKEKSCYVAGIEINEEAASEAARVYDNIILGDVETIDVLPYPSGYFDWIIFGDILEHLRRPDVVLSKFKHYVSTNGVVIAAIPNIAYAPVRLRLLTGHFDYEDRGHLDKTHLRFFTLKTAKQLLVSQGYEIVCLDYTGPASLVRMVPTLLAAKFIIIAKPII